MCEEYKRFNLLSIEAWSDPYGGWFWNAWYSIEKDIYIKNTELTARKILKFLRDSGFLAESSKGLLALDDDGYNIQIVNRKTFEPILALEYGCFE